MKIVKNLSNKVAPWIILVTLNSKKFFKLVVLAWLLSAVKRGIDKWIYSDKM